MGSPRTQCQIGRNKKEISLKSDGLGKWFDDLRIINDLTGAFDVDIEATLFTNTLPFVA